MAHQEKTSPYNKLLPPSGVTRTEHVFHSFVRYEII